MPAVRPPVMKPEPEIVAMVVFVLLQLPPEVASLTLITKPEHTLDRPEIAAGRGFTVTKSVVWHPVGKI